MLPVVTKRINRKGYPCPYAIPMQMPAQTYASSSDPECERHCKEPYGLVGSCQIAMSGPIGIGRPRVRHHNDSSEESFLSACSPFALPFVPAAPHQQQCHWRRERLEQPDATSSVALEADWDRRYQCGVPSLASVASSHESMQASLASSSMSSSSTLQPSLQQRSLHCGSLLSSALSHQSEQEQLVSKRQMKRKERMVHQGLLGSFRPVGKPVHHVNQPYGHARRTSDAYSYVPVTTW